MGKSKHFFFAVAIPVIMLFTLGNWVTSARATNTRLPNATPIPTGTPITGTDIPGEIPSAEEQEV